MFELFLKKSKDKKKIIKPLDVPQGIFKKCPSCGQTSYHKEVVLNQNICPHCKYHFPLRAYTRIDLTTDKDSFKEFNKFMKTKNPLNFPQYDKKISQQIKKAHTNEAITTGIAKIKGNRCVLCVMDSHFLMGSMGTVVGEKLTLAIEKATKRRLPIVIFIASGGARMQEGILSLMQMAKTSAALAKHNEKGLLCVCVLTHPTTGGVTASFAMLGDIILAEPQALIGFAGPRVIQQTIRQELPEGFQRSEFLLKHGFIDKVVPRHNIRETLGTILQLHKE